MKKILILFISFLFFIFLLPNCGGGEKKQTATISKVNTPQGADPSVTAEQGGNGFENIATTLGYQTYVISKDEEIYFGDPKAVKGGTVKFTYSRFPVTLRTCGQNYNYLEATQTNDLLFEYLLDPHPLTWEPAIPRLASHWKISDDNMQFWFRINPDARWSDGNRVTAKDVVATWDLRMDETILFPSDQITFGKFERPVEESLYIVSVKCKKANWRNFRYFASSMLILPAHIISELDGSEYLEKFQFSVPPNSGPYALTDENIFNQESWTLTRREDFWGRNLAQNKYMYNFNKIKWIVVKDNISLEFEKFKKGEADFYEVNASRRWIEECDFEAIQKGWIKKHKVYSERPAGTSGYDFNMRKWPFNDKRIRHAFGYLFDREKMNKEMYYNEYEMMHSFYHGSIYENPDNPKFLFNPEKAIQLLKEAGFTQKNDDGILINKDGKQLSFEIAIVKYIDYMVTPVQQMLREYGIDMQIVFMDGNTIWKNKMDRNFTVLYHSMTGSVVPNPESWFRSTLADKKDNINFWGFKNNRVDELLDEYDLSFKRNNRIEIIREIDGIVQEIHPVSFATARTYRRFLFWDKFGYPEYMAERYYGNYYSILRMWWFESDNEETLEQAMINNTLLPVSKLDVRYWQEYRKSNE